VVAATLLYSCQFRAEKPLKHCAMVDQPEASEQ